MPRAALLLCALLIAQPLAARESLGVYDDWGAFRDEKPPRCYAIAKAQGTPPAPAYASIATWPEKKVRGQLHIVLSRPVAEASSVRLAVGGKRFALVAKGRNAWASDTRADAEILAALRSASRMSVSARSAEGRTFTDRYALAGVATAMDAAIVGCANAR